MTDAQIHAMTLGRLAAMEATITAKGGTFEIFEPIEPSLCDLAKRELVLAQILVDLLCN